MSNRFRDYLRGLDRRRDRAMRGESDGFDPVRRTLNGVPQELTDAAIAIDPATASPRTSGTALQSLAMRAIEHADVAAFIGSMWAEPPAPPAAGETFRVGMPLRFDSPRDAYRPLPSPYVSYETGIDWSVAPPPATPPTRPPATPPTSTTTIGEPATIDADYAALVADLGLNSAAVDLERFKALVPELGLHVYQRAEVQEYLHSLYKVPVGDLTPTVVWGWRPLREKDRTAIGQIQFNGRVQRSAPIYSKPIPYPVLLTVKAVRDACPSAHFYVSDEMQAERIPDPFLLVIVAGQEFVIERWDEPAFRAKG